MIAWLPRPDLLSETTHGPVAALDVKSSPTGGNAVKAGSEEGVASEDAVQLGVAIGVTLELREQGSVMDCLESELPTTTG